LLTMSKDASATAGELLGEQRGAAPSPVPLV
jgi:hypothetical protein